MNERDGHWFVTESAAWNDARDAAERSAERRGAAEVVHPHAADAQCTDECVRIPAPSSSAASTRTPTP